MSLLQLERDRGKLEADFGQEQRMRKEEAEVCVCVFHQKLAV